MRQHNRIHHDHWRCRLIIDQFRVYTRNECQPIRQVRPQGAVISCGVDNPYGHPSPRTVKALEAAKVRWYVTTGGPVVVSTDGDTWKVLSGTPGGNASEDRKDATRKEGSE